MNFDIYANACNVRLLYTTGWMQMTCAKLDMQWQGACVNMQTTWESLGTLLKNGARKVSCNEGTSQNGRKAVDGKRRFLTLVEMEKSGGQFRYVFECCRFGT